MTEQITVLAIDDDASDAELLRRLLEQVPSYEIEFSAVPDIDQAREALKELAVDVMFLDYRLGAITGLDVVKELRNSGELRPIIALTGQGDEYVATQLICAGADDYLVKDDVDPEKLRRAIDNATTQYHRRRVVEENRRLLKEVQVKNDALEAKNRRLAELYETAHEFVDNVSHEFRTPLTVIKEFTSIIHEGLAGETTEEQREYLATVLNRVDDLATMVDDMLDISKLEAGLLAIYRREVPIAEIIDRTRPVIQRKAIAGDVQLAIDVEEDLPIVFCDPEKIGRVLINLAVNAIKFSPENATVHVWTHREDAAGHVRIGVTDNGPGIDPDNVTAIFERFKQIEGSVRSSTKGFGLGLNIAKELVHLNFGDIEVESTLGQGSTFSFTVPVADPIRLIDRYLDRLNVFRMGASFVSLVEALTSDLADAEQLEETDHFLQHQLRRTDVLFRSAPNRWVLVAASNQRDISAMMRRIDQAWDEANRHRPGAALTPVSLNPLGTWAVDHYGEDFRQNFANAVLPAEPSHA